MLLFQGWLKERAMKYYRQILRQYFHDFFIIQDRLTGNALNHMMDFLQHFLQKLRKDCMHIKACRIYDDCVFGWH